MYHPFSVPDTVKTSWYIFKRNFLTIIVYSIIAFILLSLLAVVIEIIISPDEFAGKMIVSLILIFFQAYSTLGLYKLIFTVIDSEYYEFEFKQIIPTVKMVFSYLVVVFIIAFLITNFTFLVEYLEKYPTIVGIVKNIGVILAIYIALRFMFFNAFIVDDNSGPIESLKQSIQLTKGFILKVFIILIVIILFIYIPAKLSQYYPLVSVTLIIIYPFVNIVLAVTYRKLIYSKQDVDDDLAETK